MLDDELVPEFHIRKCPCGETACTSMLFVMVHPVIRPTEDEGLVPCVHFPMESAQSLVDQIRRLCEEKGITVI